jgi:glycosyltransferase involved in cell wall biosynthesis
MTDSLGVSIVVVNYNNDRFLASAIDSALSQNHPLSEVIVVDDCSTDNSRAVIARYGGRIRSVLREINGHQTAALNSAWPLARYPILIFLDSDDLLLPHAAATIAERWTSATVKMQFPLITIDKEGQQTGHVAQKYARNLDTATIRSALLRTGGSPNSPASGNAYSRSLLEAVMRDGGFDLENLRKHWMDAILECNAPFYGDVTTIYEVLGCYRFHDSNLYAMTAVDGMHFVRLLNTFAFKLDYLSERCRRWGIPFDATAVCNRSPWALECKLVAAKLAATEMAREPIFTNVYRAINAYLHAPMPASQRILRMAWFASVALSPQSLARQLIGLRFLVAQRPAWIERVLAIANIAGRRRRGSSGIP